MPFKISISIPFIISHAAAIQIMNLHVTLFTLAGCYFCYYYCLLFERNANTNTVYTFSRSSTLKMHTAHTNARTRFLCKYYFKWCFVSCVCVSCVYSIICTLLPPSGTGCTYYFSCAVSSLLIRLFAVQICFLAIFSFLCIFRVLLSVAIVWFV